MRLTATPIASKSALRRLAVITFLRSTKNLVETEGSSRHNTAIRIRDAHSALAVLLPSAGESKAGCAGHAADARIQDQRPNRGIHLNDNQRFYEERLLLALERTLRLAHWSHSTRFGRSDVK